MFHQHSPQQEEPNYRQPQQLCRKNANMLNNRSRLDSPEKGTELDNSALAIVDLADDRAVSLIL